MSPLRSLYALLTDPGTFFDERPPSESLAGATVAVTVVALALVAGIALVGWVFAANVDATYTKTVREPWSDATCESFAEMNTTFTPRPCGIDEPVTKQVDVGQKVLEVLLGRLPILFVGTFVGWVLVAAGLHVATALAGGDGSFRATLSVAGWGLLPDLLSTVVTVGPVVLAIQGAAFGSDPQVVADRLLHITRATVGGWGALGAIVATAWQVYIWTHGLSRARDLPIAQAGVCAAVVGIVSLLASLL